MVAGGALAAAGVPPARFVRFSEARPILSELATRLPPQLNSLTPALLESGWPSWIAAHDRDVRVRLDQGDEDTIVNWMLFGTSFTSRPRAVLGAVESGAVGGEELVLSRTHTSYSPWIIVKANNKKRARLHSIRYLLSLMDYEGKDQAGVSLLPDPNIVTRFHRNAVKID